MKLKKIIIIGAVAVILMAVLGVFINSWTAKKMEKVILGLSAPNFPYRDYTEGELAKMYPQIKNADVATRTAPEETYAKFRQALRDNNLEMAVEQLSKDSGKYKENKEALTKAYGEGRFGEALNNYPEEVIEESKGESISSYYYFREENKEKIKTHISFIKNNDGDWKLDSL